MSGNTSPRGTLADMLGCLVEYASNEEVPSFATLVATAALNPARDFRGASLRHMDFRDQDLRGFDFSEADLTGADFRRANVEGVSFDGAKLAGTIGLLDDHPRPARSVQSHRTRQAERRQLTVMLIDLVGSAGLSERLDPEDLVDVFREFQICIESTVRHFGGIVTRYTGDGALALFGSRLANETHAERAIHAGLALIEAVGRLDSNAGPPGNLRLRVGIATGLVVIDGPPQNPEIVGDVLSVAARLSTVAEPNTVVITETTRELAGGLFLYSDLGPINLKARNDPVAAWTVTGESALESRFLALRSAQLPLVGRSNELEFLAERWEQASKRHGSVVVLNGEPGIGKSRLIAAFEQTISKVPHSVGRFSCSPRHQQVPLYPLARQLGLAQDRQQADPSTKRSDELVASLPPQLVADIVAISEGHSADSLSGPTVSALLRELADMSRHDTLLLVVDDLQWADTATLNFIDRLVEMAPALPMLLVLSSRTDVPPLWVGLPHVYVQMLGPLSPQDAFLLIENFVQGAPLSQETIKAVAARADGIPLFLEELVKLAIERSRSHHSDQQLPDSAVPTTLGAIVAARLDRLSASKEIARIGAVIGREFSFSVLQTISGYPEARLEDGLEEMVQAGLLIRRGEPPDSTYIFLHKMIWEAARASLLHSERRAIELRLAAVT